MTYIKFFNTIILLLTICVELSAQSVQHGMTLEYRGKEEKIPLAGVSLNAGGATAKSNSYGMFKLTFNNLNVGDPIMADPATCALLKDYVVFNVDAINQWHVSAPGSMFSIVLCRKDRFDNLVMSYYKVSDKSLEKQLNIERKKIKQMMQDGKIQQQEYERQIQEAEEQYQQARDALQETAELVARIDESELDENQVEILDLAKKGKLDEAVELIRHGNTLDLLEKAKLKRDYAAEQEQFFREKKGESIEEINRLISCLKNNINVMLLAGGRQNYDSCAVYWHKIIAADTENADNLYDAALFFFGQNDFLCAERYCEKALAIYEKTAETMPNDYNKCNLGKALSTLASIYQHVGKTDEAGAICERVLMIFKDVAKSYKIFENKSSVNIFMRYMSAVLQEKDTDRQLNNALKLLDLLNDEYMFNADMKSAKVGCLLIIATAYQMKGMCPAAEDYNNRASIICDELVATDRMKYGHNKIFVLNGLGNLYRDFLSVQNKAESCYMKSLELCRILTKINPDAYNPDYANTLYQMGFLYVMAGRISEAKNYCLQSLNIYDELVLANPNVFNPMLSLALSKYAHCCSYSNETDLAETHFKRALNLLEQIEKETPGVYSLDLFYTLYDLAWLYNSTGNYQEAEKYYLRLLDVYQTKLKSESWASVDARCGDALCTLGFFHYQSNQIEKAKEFTKESIQMYAKIIDVDTVFVEGFCVGNDNMAYYSLLTSDFVAAERYERVALKVMPTRILSKTNLITALLFQGKYEEAETIALKIINIELDGQLVRNVILDDLKTFEDKGIIPEERKAGIERFRNVLSFTDD